MAARVGDDGGRSTWWSDWVAHPRYGPLPAMLIALTVVSGLVDAVSILALGRVFVANMTGNVVFVGFALSGAPGFSLQGSLVALGGFVLGAGVGGQLVGRLGAHRGRLLGVQLMIEVALFGAATVLLAVAARPFGVGVQDVVAALAAIALGGQNAVVRSLAVPDLTTTVVTMTLTGVAADLRQRDYPVATRRILALAAMLLGAAVGAVLVREVAAWTAMLAATGLVLAVLVAAGTLSRRPSVWSAA